MIVRFATPDHASAIAAVEVATWQTAYQELLPATFLQALSINSKAQEWRNSLLKHRVGRQKRVLVALEGEEVVGFVRVGTAHEDQPIGLIYLLYVLPPYWKHGIGTELMQGAVHELIDLGHQAALLWVLRDNKRARQFYEHLGWRQDGRTTAVEYGDVSLQALCYQRSVQPLVSINQDV